jgi:hypothetical protein
MSWDLQYPPALWAAAVLVGIGTLLSFQGDMGWVFGLPLYAVGLGSLAAAFTVVEGG